MRSAVWTVLICIVTRRVHPIHANVPQTTIGNIYNYIHILFKNNYSINNKVAHGKQVLQEGYIWRGGSLKKLI